MKRLKTVAMTIAIAVFGMALLAGSADAQTFVPNPRCSGLATSGEWRLVGDQRFSTWMYVLHMANGNDCWYGFDPIRDPGNTTHHP